MPGQQQSVFDDAASAYFLGGVLGLISLIATIVAYRMRPKRSSSWCSSSSSKLLNNGGCHCPACSQKDEYLRTRGPQKNVLKFYFVLSLAILLWAAFAMFARNAVVHRPLTEMKPAFNPYEILGLPESATEDVIKQAYRQLTIKWHPDKNPGNEKATEMFVMIKKAYETLTSELVRRNYELYGNPDGPQPVSVGIALPSWLLDKNNSKWVLLVYMFAFLVGVPIVVCCVTRKWKRNVPNSVRMETMALFNQLCKDRMNQRQMLEILCGSWEFKLLHKLRRSDVMELAKLERMMDESHRPLRKLQIPWVPKTSLLLHAHLWRLHGTMSPRLLSECRELVAAVPQLVGGMCLLFEARRWLTPMLDAIRLCQLFVQAAWGDYQMLQLPYIDIDLADECKKKRWNELETPLDLAKMNARTRPRLIQYLDINEKQLVDIAHLEAAVFAVRLNVFAVPEIDGEEDLELKHHISCQAVVTLVVKSVFKLDDRVTIAALLKSAEPQNDDEDVDDEEEAKTTTNTSKQATRRHRQCGGGRNNSRHSPQQQQTTEEETTEETAEEEEEEGEQTTVSNKEMMEEKPAVKSTATTMEETPLIHAPYFPEEKRENWWFILGEPAKNLVHAVTKGVVPAGLGCAPTECKMQFLAPETPGEYHWTLYCLSDSYIGRDVTVSVKFKVFAEQPNAAAATLNKPTDGDDEDDEDEEYISDDLSSDSEDERDDNNKKKNKKTKDDSSSESPYTSEDDK